jgi:HK97 family phage major capsid protein
VAGIRRNISVGYEIRAMERTKRGSGREPDEYTVSSWLPWEVSIVSVAADPGVGIGRSGETSFPVRVIDRSQTVMNENAAEREDGAALNTRSAAGTGTEENSSISVIRETTRADESKRIRAIYEIGRRFGANEEAESYVRSGQGVDELEHYILTQKLRAQPLAGGMQQQGVGAQIGMSRADMKSYSILKIIRELSEPGGRLTNALPPDQKRNRVYGNSAFIAADARLSVDSMGGGIGISHGRNTRQLIPGQRDMNVTMAVGVGDSFVEETLLPSVVDYLRNALMIKTAGCVVLDGLQGHILIPKVAGVPTAYFLSETDPVIPSDITTTQIPLRPRRISSQTILSRQLAIQSVVSIEDLIRQEISRSMAQEIDRVALFGDPGVNAAEPIGLFLYPGLPPDPRDPNDIMPVVVFGATGSLYEDYVAFVENLAIGNIPMSRPAWLANARSWGNAITTPKFPNTGDPIIDTTAAGKESVLGIRYLRTNQIPTGASPMANRVVLGDWAQFISAQWSGIELIVDGISRAGTAQIIVTTNAFVDQGVRYRRGFCLSTNAGLLRGNGNGPGQPVQGPVREDTKPGKK